VEDWVALGRFGFYWILGGVFGDDDVVVAEVVEFGEQVFAAGEDGCKEGED